MVERTCGECGARLEVGVAVCPNCGAPSPYKVCSECGEFLSIDEKICRNCGAPCSEPSLPVHQTQPISALTTCALVFAFVFPLAGLVMSIVGLKTLPEHEHSKCKVALISSIIMLILFGILAAIFLPKLFRILSTGGKISDIYNSFFG